LRPDYSSHGHFSHQLSLLFDVPCAVKRMWNPAVQLTGDSTVVFSFGAQVPFTVAYNKAVDTPDGNTFAWRRRSRCLTVIRVNRGLGSIQAFYRTGA
jgi:hypothetical protein